MSTLRERLRDGAVTIRALRARCGELERENEALRNVAHAAEIRAAARARGASPMTGPELVAALEGLGWSVTVRKSYDGDLQRYRDRPDIRRAAAEVSA